MKLKVMCSEGPIIKFKGSVRYEQKDMNISISDNRSKQVIQLHTSFVVYYNLQFLVSCHRFFGNSRSERKFY